MSVILPWDRGYRRAKKARQGRSTLPARFYGFVAEFAECFGVRHRWLEADHLDHAGEAIPKPRLEVVIERTADHRKFLTAPYNFDAVRQRKVAGVFAKHFSPRAMASMFKLPRSLRGIPRARRRVQAHAEGIRGPDRVRPTRGPSRRSEGD